MRRFRTGSLLAVSLVLWGAPPSRGQEKEGDRRPLPTPMEERVLVQLVQVPILARDRQGNPVTDLKPEEIEVKLRGRKMALSYLEPLSASLGDRGEQPEVRLFLDAPGGWTLPVSTSRTPPRYIAFLVDNENDPPVRRQEALEKALEFVDRGLDPSVRTAVLSYAGDANLELPFTEDRAALRAALLQASAREGRPRRDNQTRMRNLLRQMDDCVIRRSDFGNIGDFQCMRDVANEYIGEVRPLARDFIQGLQGVVDYMGGLRGRKSVFVLSHGVPIDSSPVVIAAARGVFGDPGQISDLQLYIGFGQEERVAMDRLLDSLIRNRVTLSFIDRSSPPTGDFQAERGQMLAAGQFPMRAEFDAAVADMEQIAYTSGGVHLQMTDVGEGLGKAFDMQRGAYEVGFQTDEYLDSEKLAKVTIDTTRRGVKILHRRGVYASPPESERTLRGRIAFPKGRRLEASPAGGLHQPFLLEVDPEAIGYTVGETAAEADFSVHFEILTREGLTLAETYHFVSHAYDRETWIASDRAPMTLTGWVELPPGEFTLQASLRNVRSGREGVVRQSVRVPETSPPPAESNPSGQG